MRQSIAGLAILIALTAGAALPARARAVDLALVLAVDVSGSVNTERYELQRQGYAKAFASREVIEAILGGQHHAIAVTLVEWSGASHQRQMVGWTVIDDAASAAAFSSAVAETPRAFADWTAISGGIDYSVALLKDADLQTTRRVIDVSGDGVNNNGGDVARARDEAVAAGFIINGLPILSEYPELDAYYRENVIGGPDAFVVVAKDFGDFARAVLGKLIREIAFSDGLRQAG